MDRWWKRHFVAIWACAAAVGLAGCVIVAAVVEPANDLAGQSSFSGKAPEEEEEFENPEAIVRRFRNELGRLAESEELTSPADLVRQAESQKTFVVKVADDPRVKLTPEAIYKRAKQSVVIVGAISRRENRPDWQALCATGFVIGKDGVIVTNDHLVKSFQKADAVGVMTHDGRVFPVQGVLASDEHNDVTILKVAAENLVPLPIARSAPVGTTVFCLSHPALNSAGTENAFYTFTSGMVCGKFQARASGRRRVDVLAVTADYARGSSGGPLLNEHGAVVGLVCQTLPIFHDPDRIEVQMIWKFARPSNSILALLREKP